MCHILRAPSMLREDSASAVAYFEEVDACEAAADFWTTALMLRDSNAS